MFRVTVAQRRLERRQRRGDLAVALKLGDALIVGRLDGSADLRDVRAVLAEDERNGILGGRAVDAVGLEHVDVGPQGVRAGDYLGGTLCHIHFLSVRSGLLLSLVYSQISYYRKNLLPAASKQKAPDACQSAEPGSVCPEFSRLNCRAGR